MNTGLLVGTLGLALATGSLTSIVERGIGIPRVSVIAGTVGAGLLLAMLGAAAPQLANGLTALLLLTLLLRFPWAGIAAALDRITS